MIPDFAGKVIYLVKLGWGLHLWTEDNWELTLSEPILVTTADEGRIRQTEVVVDVEPGPLPQPLADLEGSTITALLISREGHLGIQLPGRHLTVSPSSRYESWQIAGPRSERLICWVDGRLEYYSPDS